MELYKEIILKALENENVNITFSGLTINATEIVQLRCYKALNQIKSIIKNDNLNDNECFMKIEAIVSEFENIGSNGGNRHDF